MNTPSKNLVRASIGYTFSGGEFPTWVEKNIQNAPENVQTAWGKAVATYLSYRDHDSVDFPTLLESITPVLAEDSIFQKWLEEKELNYASWKELGEAEEFFDTLSVKG